MESVFKKKERQVALILCPPWGIDYPPIQLAYIASFLSQKGIPISLFDLNIDLYNMVNDSLKNEWDTTNFTNWYLPEKAKPLIDRMQNYINLLINRLAASNSAALCFSVNSGNIYFTKHVISKLEDSNVPVILGGPGIKNSQLRSLFDGLKISKFIDSEGQQASIELYAYLKDLNYGHKLRKRRLLEPVFPDYTFFDLKKYKMEQLPFILSRGCIRKCLFCNDIHINSKYFHRDAKLVFEELEYYNRKYHIRNFESHDLLINGNLEELERLCDYIIASGLDIEWHGQAIIRQMSESLMSKLRRAGMKTFLFGLETASDRLLKNMHKYHTAALAEEIIRKANRVGIDVYLNLMVGIPGEEQKDIEVTKKFLLRIRKIIKEISNLNMFILLKESELYEKRDLFGIGFHKDAYYIVDWFDKNGNTIELRKKRLDEMITFLKEINIPLHETNSYWLE